MKFTAFTARKTMAMATIAMVGIIGMAPEAYAGTCKTLSYFPGVIQVFGTAKGTSTSDDSAYCTAVNACPQNAAKVEVVGLGVASTPGSIVAVSSAGKQASGDEVSASCEAALTQGKTGQALAGACTSEAAAIEGAGAMTQADCALFVSTPANGSVAGSATCFCGAD
jgi:hypothetical protein